VFTSVVCLALGWRSLSQSCTAATGGQQREARQREAESAGLNWQLCDRKQLFSQLCVSHCLFKLELRFSFFFSFPTMIDFFYPLPHMISGPWPGRPYPWIETVVVLFNTQSLLNCHSFPSGKGLTATILWSFFQTVTLLHLKKLE
jgi:hypothetical protein